MTLDDDIRVLTVLEPWASLVALGRKNVENRPASVAAFASKHPGQWLAIHAGGIGRPGPGYGSWAEAKAPDGMPWPSHLLTGNLVALVKIRVVYGPDQGLENPWRVRGQHGIVLSHLHRLDLIPCKGGQGWRVLKRIDQGRPWAALAEQMLGH